MLAKVGKPGPVHRSQWSLSKERKDIEGQLWEVPEGVVRNQYHKVEGVGRREEGRKGLCFDVCEGGGDQGECYQGGTGGEGNLVRFKKADIRGFENAVPSNTSWFSIIMYENESANRLIMKLPIKKASINEILSEGSNWESFKLFGN